MKNTGKGNMYVRLRFVLRNMRFTCTVMRIWDRQGTVGDVRRHHYYKC